jgi:hypothetical protein
MLRLTFARAAMLAVVALLAFATRSASAQSGRGLLSGFVSDSATAANGIAGARVELRAPTGWQRSKEDPKTTVVFTNGTGNYSTPLVRMGEYALRITAEGFEPYETTMLIGSDMHAVLGTILKKSAAQSAAQRLVEELNVEGNRRLKDKWILSHLKTRPGDAFVREQIKKDLEALLDLDVFDPERTSLKTEDGVRGGVVVTFTVVELPLIDRVTFKGLPRGITEQDVRAYLLAHKIKLSEGYGYHPTKLQWAQNYFNEFLLTRGLWRVSATGTARRVAPAHVSVEFHVAPNGND